MAPYLFFSTVDWDVGSALIRFGTRSDFSHCGFYLDDGWTLDSRFHPFNKHKDGVQYRSPKQHKDWTRLELYRHPRIDDAIQAGADLVGRCPYDWPAIFGIATDHDWHNDHEKICSEFLGWCFWKIGFPLLRDTKTWELTPRDVWLSKDITPAARHLWLPFK